jgi:hypothetical protein
LYPTQYGFRNGRGTRDYVALLLTAIQTSFEYKQPTLVGFLDISMEHMIIVKVMWNRLWRKEVVFYYENQPVVELVGFKGLSQGLAVSIFSYSFYTSQADRVLPFRCSMLQYADDLAVYASQIDVEKIQ